MRLLLLRHAETEWNRERRFQGWRDSSLSAVGREQAESAARLLAEAAVAAVWSSPLARARETAALIAAPHRLPVREAEAFKEMGFGAWEGLTRDEVQARFPEDLRAWAEAPHEATWPGAETLAAVRGRALEGLAALRQGHAGETVCLVSHGITCRVIILEALGLGLDRLWSIQLSSTGISELEFRDDWTTLHRMNSLIHLTDVAIA
ncbi:MAG TPA: histidine phosphatase family protein [Methylomirabilota bacterium]|nr:histidine phosphatase family protein [Methylomirabilota bacterium]